MNEEMLTDLAESDVDSTPQESRKVLKSLDHIKVQFIKKIFKSQCHCQVRQLKNKGAILILVWNFLVWSVYNHSTDTTLSLNNVANLHGNLDYLFYVVQAIAGGLIMPLAGWLADVRFGRYKVIRWSIWIMWLSSVVVTLSFVLAHMVESYEGIHVKLYPVLIAIMSIGFCGFQANIVQFGIDQLIDASTIEITSFIAWYAGSFLSGRFAVSFILSCAQSYAQLFGPLLKSFNISVVMVTYFLFNHLLVKEPATVNPFKLVYNVVKYAIKNKYPRQRSAFTYCEDNLPSRIDFGKHKYGGPFTTEQVEDVKTLFRSLLIAVVITAFYGMSYTETEYVSRLEKALIYRTSDENDVPLQRCFSDYTSFTGAYFVAAMVLIPFNEFLVYPVLHGCLPYLKIYTKFILGAVLRIGNYISLLALTTYARHHYVESTSSRLSNTTLLCLYQANAGSLTNAIDSKWFILPQILHSLSDLLLVITMIEFFCAQVPYSMKGIVAGITYGLLGTFFAVDKTISIPFTINASYWGVRTISCEFWYLLTKVLFLTLVTVLSSIARWYKLRKREDVLPNEQIFVERYYSSDN